MNVVWISIKNAELIFILRDSSSKFISKIKKKSLCGRKNWLDYAFAGIYRRVEYFVLFQSLPQHI